MKQTVLLTWLRWIRSLLTMFCSSTSFFCHCCLSWPCFSDSSDWSSMHSFLKRKFMTYSVKPRPNERNMSTQHITKLLGATCWARLVALLIIFELDPTTPNMSQQGGQTRATCCAQQCCVNMLRSFGPGLTRHLCEKKKHTVLRNFLLFWMLHAFPLPLRFSTFLRKQFSQFPAIYFNFPLPLPPRFSIFNPFSCSLFSLSPFRLVDHFRFLSRFRFPQFPVFNPACPPCCFSPCSCARFPLFSLEVYKLSFS